MPTISQLSAVTSLAAGDNIVIQSAANNDARKASLSVLLAYIESNFASPDYTVTISSPIAGFNQQLATSASSIWLILTPAGTLATGTVTLPPVADLFDGQEVLVTSSQVITALTVAGNGATVSGAPTSFGTGGFFALRYNTLLTTWFCTSQSLGATDVFTDITVTNAILDANGNELVKFIAEAAAVNELTILNGATGNEVGLAATGGDTNIALNLTAKGSGNLNLNTDTGTVKANGIDVVDLSLTQTLTNKTLTGPITDAVKMGGAGTSTVALLNLAYPPATSIGFRTVVIDATTTLILGLGTTVNGTGANVVPVYCDGVTWKYG